MAEVEKIASDRYRLRSHDQIITLSAQDLLGAMDYALEHAAQLRQEASQVHQGECVECGRFSSQLTEKGYCEGCVMQAAITAMEPEERWK